MPPLVCCACRCRGMSATRAAWTQPAVTCNKSGKIRCRGCSDTQACCRLCCALPRSVPITSRTEGSAAATTAAATAAAGVGPAAAPAATSFGGDTVGLLHLRTNLLHVCLGARCHDNSSRLGLATEVAAAAMEAKHPVLLLPAVVVRVQTSLAAPIDSHMQA